VKVARKRIARGDTRAPKDRTRRLPPKVVFHGRMAEEAGMFDFDEVDAAMQTR